MSADTGVIAVVAPPILPNLSLPAQQQWLTRRDIASMVPCLLRVLARRHTVFGKRRDAAARVLLWPIIQNDAVDEPSFVVDGVGLMRVPEVRAELESLKQLAEHQY